MNLTDNHIALRRLKRDLGIRVDNNPVSEYLNGNIIKKYIKSYFIDNFWNEEKKEYDVVTIAKYFKVSLTRAEDFAYGYFGNITNITNAKYLMELYKEHGEVALIWFLINKKEFKILYPKK